MSSVSLIVFVTSMCVYKIKKVFNEQMKANLWMFSFEQTTKMTRKNFFVVVFGFFSQFLTPSIKIVNRERGTNNKSGDNNNNK